MTTNNISNSLLNMIEKAEQIENGINALLLMNDAHDGLLPYESRADAERYIIDTILDDMQDLRAAMTVEYAKQKDHAVVGA